MRTTAGHGPKGFAGLLGLVATLCLATGQAASAPTRSAAPGAHAPRASQAQVLELDRAGPRKVGGALKKVWRALDRRGNRPRV